MRKIDTFRGESAFGSWVYRIVSNAVYGKIRGRSKEFVNMALDEICRPFHEEGHEGLVSAWSSGFDDPGGQTELRSALSSALTGRPDVWCMRPSFGERLVVRNLEHSKASPMLS